MHGLDSFQLNGIQNWVWVSKGPELPLWHRYQCASNRRPRMTESYQALRQKMRFNIDKTPVGVIESKWKDGARGLQP